MLPDKLCLCQRRSIDPSRANSPRIGRRHQQTVRLWLLRHLFVAGRTDEIPTTALEGELPPLTTTERYRRASERRSEWRGVYGAPIPLTECSLSGRSENAGPRALGRGGYSGSLESSQPKPIAAFGVTMRWRKRGPVIRLPWDSPGG